MTNGEDPDQKPTDLDLHCLLRQSMSYSAREGLKVCHYKLYFILTYFLFVCVDVLWHNQPNVVIMSLGSLPYHTFTGQA